MVIEHGPHRTVDSWTDVGDDDDDFCYVCDDWTEDDGSGNCKDCGVSFKTIDPFISPSTAKVYSSPGPRAWFWIYMGWWWFMVGWFRFLHFSVGWWLVIS